MGSRDFVPTSIWTISHAGTGNAVFLKPEQSAVVLPVYVSENDIQTILVELTRILAPRPMIHEQLLSVASALGARFLRSEIYACRQGSYLCTMVLEKDGTEICLDSRPSDILCLAARTQSAVLVAEDVLMHNGIPADRVAGTPESDGDIREPASVVSFLKRELQTAVDHEEFERAAHLRDRLAELSRHH